MGGQACILYGGAEFSRDIDIAIELSAANLQKLRTALKALGAQKIFYPGLSEKELRKGHACHFRCGDAEFNKLRIDIMGVMRGGDPFPSLWKRRNEIDLPGIGEIAVMNLKDLVSIKKTQRDKDWPMIRRLVEADIIKYRANPSHEQLSFWLMECRSPELLVALAMQFPENALSLKPKRELLETALDGDMEELRRLLRDEEEQEKALDREYWKPLKKELEKWRLERG